MSIEVLSVLGVARSITWRPILVAVCMATDIWERFTFSGARLSSSRHLREFSSSSLEAAHSFSDCSWARLAQSIPAWVCSFCRH